MSELVRTATDTQITWGITIFLVVQLVMVGALIRQKYSNHKLKDDLRAYYRMKQTIESLPKGVRRSIKYGSIYE